MKKLKQIYQIYEEVDNLNVKEKRKTICKNIKRIRKDLYNNYKELYHGVEGIQNPYSTENVSSYLGISMVHYKRLENEKDTCKNITLDNLIKLSLIFDTNLQEFLLDYK